MGRHHEECHLKPSDFHSTSGIGKATPITATFDLNWITSPNSVLPGIGGYKETNDSVHSPEDDRNNGRQIIESPDHKRYNGTTFAATADSAALGAVKISWRVPDSMSWSIPATRYDQLNFPDATTAQVAPRSYRRWLNTRSGSSHVCTEVVLHRPAHVMVRPPAWMEPSNTADDGCI